MVTGTDRARIEKSSGTISGWPRQTLNRLKGASCTATLDVDAKTLTFEHWGFGSSAEQKSLSPVVVPLGAISSVGFEKRWYGSWLSVALRGQQPWLHGVRTDPHGLTCGDDPTPFAEAVRAAVASVEPLGEDEWEPPEARETLEGPPSWRLRFAKGAAVAVVNGFFNTRYPSPATVSQITLSGSPQS